MTHTMNDPAVPDWANMELPDTYADRIQWWNLWSVMRLLLKVVSCRQRVLLPENVPGADQLPKYIFQEFHNLPSGNYSKRLTHGYITGFDRIMLGCMRSARQQLAEHKENGWRGLYFKFLAGAVHEPFARAWHAMNFQQALSNARFSVICNDICFPVRCSVARKMPVHCRP